MRTTTPHRAPGTRRGFSMIEMLLAISISATLLTATMAALDSMYKGYKQTTESASTHVISRIVMSRLLGMIRTGTDFGPVPLDVLDSQANPLAADFFEFVSVRDDTTDEPLEMIRVEWRVPGEEAELRSWSVADGPPEPDPDDPQVAGELWYVRLDLNADPPSVIDQRPLLSGVRSAIFTLEYDVGPTLVRGTVDLIVEPNDSQDLTIGADARVQTFRLIASTAPRSGVTDD